MHRPVIIISRFFLFFFFPLPESHSVPVQEAVLRRLTALLSGEIKISLARKDPGALTSCKYS